MPHIIVYSGPNCPFCERAKALLKKKGAAFDDINVKADEAKLAEMMERTSGKRTIPQIFIGDRHIGGCDDLYDLEETGRLDPLLTA